MRDLSRSSCGVRVHRLPSQERKIILSRNLIFLFVMVFCCCVIIKLISGLVLFLWLWRLLKHLTGGLYGPVNVFLWGINMGGRPVWAYNLACSLKIMTFNIRVIWTIRNIILCCSIIVFLQIICVSVWITGSVPHSLCVPVFWGYVYLGWKEKLLFLPVLLLGVKY